MFEIRLKKSDCVIAKADDLETAYQIINDFETQDYMNGCYEPHWYVVFDSERQKYVKSM